MSTPTPPPVVVGPMNQAVAALALKVANDVAALRRQTYAGGSTMLGALRTTTKGSLLAAINELADRPIGAPIDDITATGSTVYSSARVAALVAQAVADVKATILGGAGAAYDTLQEVKAIIDADEAADFAQFTTILTALGKRLRFDTAQTLTATEQAQARANIGAVAAADVGPTDTDYVAVYVAGLG